MKHRRAISNDIVPVTEKRFLISTISCIIKLQWSPYLSVNKDKISINVELVFLNQLGSGHVGPLLRSFWVHRNNLCQLDFF